MSFDFMEYKNHLQVWTKILRKAKLIIFFTRSSSLKPDDSGGRIARELSWTNRALSSVDIIPPWFSMFIYHVGKNNRPVGGRSSEM
jgi:hypothetical protein